MDYFNTLLEHQPFVAGDSFSMADITVIGGLIFAALVDVAIPDHCHALRAWHENVQQRPSVQNWSTISQAV
jgi:glutathione S-transferase